eukprot:scaffold18152_cov88-Phaeocystis_antarctica.AAC.5
MRQSVFDSALEGTLCDVPINLSALGQPLRHRQVGLLVVVHEDELATHRRVYDSIYRLRERFLRPVEKRCDSIKRSVGATVDDHLVQVVQSTGARFVEHEVSSPFTAPDEYARICPWSPVGNEPAETVYRLPRSEVRPIGRGASAMVEDDTPPGRGVGRPRQDCSKDVFRRVELVEVRNDASVHFHTGTGCQPQKDCRDSAVHAIAQP